ncbi:MAG: ABC transporter substrate-binding protein [Dehalococcoidia bacterium]
MYKVNSRMVTRRRLLRGTVASGGIAALFLAACGGDSDDGTSESGTGAAQQQADGQPASAAPAGPPDRSARVTLNGSDIDSFDAITGTGGNGQQFLWTVFDNIIAYDAKLMSQPSRSLAETWEYSDPATLVFRLRKGVTFHDGTAFNAAAVKANWQHVVTNGSRSGATADLQAIDTVETPDDSTAIFKMKRPDGGLITKLGDRPGFQSSPAALEKFGGDFQSGDYKRNPVGTGAFIFDGWQQSNYLRVKSNPNYWQADCPKVAGIEWKVIPDPNTAFAGFRTGDLNLLWGVQADKVKTVKELPKTVFQQQVGVSIPSFTLNTMRPPFNNPRAGRALSFAINRQAIIDGLFGGLARPASTWIGPGNAEFDPNYKGLWHDPAKAKQELAAGGLTSGFKFLITSGTSPTDLQVLQVIQSQIAEFGMQMEIEQHASYTARFQDENIGDGFYSAYSGRAEPSQSFNFKDAAAGVYVSGGTKPADPGFERMLADLEATLDAKERQKKLYQLADYVNERGWDVFLWHPDTLTARHESVSLEVFGDGKPHLGQCDISVSG